ncbi:MAG: SlyX family protein [Parvibaculum sp.]|nr:SlyX family protein [Parvibaculum sp.]MBO6690629.1 SlyX family protein [Parvibaculum sp.]MBO6714998.1 SlyX family protein [Parvibaculum sp.]HAC60007.1 SlyX protein [Rhodobiaceae bacterium]
MGEQERLMQRVDELEIRLAHQDRTIEELNEAFATQWRAIDETIRKLAVLENRLLSLEQSTSAPSSSEPPPPHY